MITYHLHTKQSILHRLRDLTKITNGRDPQEYRLRIKQMFDMGMDMWVAMDEAKIVGTIGFMISPGSTGFNKDPEFVAATEAKGIDPNTVQVRSLIYVDPDYRGQGIAHELEVRANATSRDLGFKYRAAFAYDTDEIYTWIHRHGNAIDLDMIDPTGYPRTLVPIDTP